MITLIEGQGGQSTDAYVELLMSEPTLNGKPLLVIEDLIMLAVHGGKGPHGMTHVTVIKIRFI
jgi:hypothetical protein